MEERGGVNLRRGINRPRLSEFSANNFKLRLGLDKPPSHALYETRVAHAILTEVAKTRAVSDWERAVSWQGPLRLGLRSCDVRVVGAGRNCAKALGIDLPAGNDTIDPIGMGSHSNWFQPNVVRDHCRSNLVRLWIPLLCRTARACQWAYADSLQKVGTAQDHSPFTRERGESCREQNLQPDSSHYRFTGCQFIDRMRGDVYVPPL